MNTVIDDKYKWAFAVDKTRPLARSRRLPMPQRYLDRYVITACSPRLKAVGVGAGMHYAEAKKLVPGLRVIVSNH